LLRILGSGNRDNTIADEPVERHLYMVAIPNGFFWGEKMSRYACPHSSMYRLWKTLPTIADEPVERQLYRMIPFNIYHYTSAIRIVV
jgi:hypothetical protein